MYIEHGFFNTKIIYINIDPSNANKTYCFVIEYGLSYYLEL